MIKKDHKNHYQKKLEYNLTDVEKNVEEAKVFYREFDNQHLGIESKLSHFIKCLEDEMQNREILVPEIKNFHKKYFIKNPYYAQTSLSEDLFNLVTFNLWKQQKHYGKYILKIDSNYKKPYEKIITLAKKDKILKEKTETSKYNFLEIFRYQGYGKYYDIAEYYYEKKLPQFKDDAVILVQSYSDKSWGIDGVERNMFETYAYIYYDYSPLEDFKYNDYGCLKAYDYNHIIKNLKKIDIKNTEKEFIKFLSEQKKIFYAKVVVPLLGRKKSANEQFLKELRIKKHQTTDGYIYILTNQGFPDFIKIGSTMKDPRIRADELTGTGVPFPYKVNYKVKTKNCEILEKKVHEILEKKRVNLEREFFNCSVDEAIKVINNVVEENKN